ncbi:MAG: hypothetical protein AAF334_04065 [Pseudomonadota bacterium]
MSKECGVVIEDRGLATLRTGAFRDVLDHACGLSNQPVTYRSRGFALRVGSQGAQDSHIAGSRPPMPSPDGLWQRVLEGLNDRKTVPESAEMIERTIVRAHHQAAGAKEELPAMVLAAQKARSRRGSAASRMGVAYP